jgi:hypothetical protein
MAMTDIKIVNNLLPKGYAEQIRTDINQYDFPWWYCPDVTYQGSVGNAGLTHVVYDMGGNMRSDWYPFFKPMVYHIEEANGVRINELLRIRVGLLMRGSGDINTPHVDYTVPHYTACYYVEDSDGDTVIYDQMMEENQTSIENQFRGENEVFTEAGRGKPIYNSVCIFDGRRYHASSVPKFHDKRIVITVNYR